MTTAIRSELIKLRTSRALMALAAAGLVYAALNGVATAALAGRDSNAALGTPANLANILRGGNVAMWVVMLSGLLSITGEYRHRTVTGTFLATPRRQMVVAAKVAVHGVLGVLYAVLSMAVGLASAAPKLVSGSAPVDLIDAHLGRVALGMVIASGLFGVAGIGVGALVRNQTAATVGMLVWLVAAENVVGSVAGWRIARWFPGQAAAAAAGSGADILLPMGAGALLFTGYAVAATLLGTRLAISRDVT